MREKLALYTNLPEARVQVKYLFYRLLQISFSY